MSAPDVKASAYASPQIDRAIESASRAVDRLTHRGDDTRPGFAPWTGTLSFAYPNTQDAGTGRLWLDGHSLTSLTSMTSGGVSIDTADVFLEPSAYGPPYSYIEIDRSSSAALSSNNGTSQRSLALTGVWCGCPVDEDPVTGALSSSVTSSATTIATTRPYGVGSILRIESERLLVTDKAWASTGQTGSLAASNAAQSLTVSDATAFRVGEELLIDSERVLIRDIAGSVLIVQRAWSGSTLAAHSTATIYYARTLTVTRGALGTTAAAHSSSATVYQHLIPGPTAELTRAYALDAFMQGSSAYARTVGSGENERTVGGRAIQLLEERVYGMYARKPRIRAV